MHVCFLVFFFIDRSKKYQLDWDLARYQMTQTMASPSQVIVV